MLFRSGAGTGGTATTLVFASRRPSVATNTSPSASNSTRTPLDSETRQMWIDLLRWISERLATQGPTR